MKVLMISGDKNLLDPNTSAYKRFELQRSAVDELDVFVWPQVHTKWQIWQAARKNRYDVITSQDPFWRGLLALKIGFLTRTKVNIQVHADLYGQGLVKHILAQIVLRHADSIRVVSEKLKTQIERMGVKSHVHVLPIFVDVDRFRSIVLRPHDDKRILWTGRFEPEKDPLRAIVVLKEVIAAGLKPRLIMIGSGSLDEEVSAAAKGLSIETPIDIPGWQTDISFYLEQADVVLCTSKTESWGASIVEALAARVPVVAPDVGIAKEAGAIVVPREKLAEEVIKVLQHPCPGELKLKLLSAAEWAAAWRNSLI